MKPPHLLARSTHIILSTLFIFLLLGSALFAQEPANTEKDTGINSGDIFEYVIILGYMLGVFVLLPWVVYTNLNENLTILQHGADSLPNSSLSEDERNRQAVMLLEEIEKKLTPFNENGEELKTVTKGSQARFIKKSVEYIRQELQPTDPDIVDRVNEIVEVYNDRTRRIFTGSKWIIACSVGIGVLLFWQAGFNTFIIIHFLGVAFYILSSRTPMYLLEKRIKFFGSFGGAIVGALFSGLFIGSGAKYYKVYSDGRKERDYESEFTGGMVYLFLMAVVAMILGFLAAALGIVNFLMNYMNNALLPVKPASWYNKNFAQNGSNTAFKTA